MSQALTNEVAKVRQQCNRLQEQYGRLLAAIDDLHGLIGRIGEEVRQLEQTKQNRRGPKPNGERHATTD